jgi:hypothetical protein
MERRRGGRVRTLKSAKILFNNHYSVIDCTVRNLSSSGACLQVASSVGIPERFDMILDGMTRPCRTVWRRERQLGVEFQEGQSAHPAKRQ